MKKLIILLTAILLLTGCSKGVSTEDGSKENGSKDKITTNKKKDVYVKQIIVDEPYYKMNKEFFYNKDGSIAYIKSINSYDPEVTDEERLEEIYYYIVENTIVVDVYLDSELNNTETYDLDGNLLSNISVDGSYDIYIDRLYNKDKQIAKINYRSESKYDDEVFIYETVYEFFYKDKKLIKYTAITDSDEQEFIYDENGKITSISMKSGDYEYYTRYEYDKKGRVTLIDSNDYQTINEYSKKKKVSQYSDGDILTERVELYDNNDKVISIEDTEYFEDNTSKVRYIFEASYDDKGNKIKESNTSYGEDESISYFDEIQYEYDSLNRLIKTTVYNGELDGVTEYSYLSLSFVNLNGLISSSPSEDMAEAKWLSFAISMPT